MWTKILVHKHTNAYACTHRVKDIRIVKASACASVCHGIAHSISAAIRAYANAAQQCQRGPQCAPRIASINSRIKVCAVASSAFVLLIVCAQFERVRTRATFNAAQHAAYTRTENMCVNTHTQFEFIKGKVTFGYGQNIDDDNDDGHLAM